MGMSLTPVAPTCRGERLGRLSADASGAGAPVRERGGLPRVSRAAAVAGGRVLPGLRGHEGVDDSAGTLDVRRVRTPRFGHRGNDLSGHPHASAAVVPGDLVGDQPEDRSQRPRGPEDPGARQLQDRMDVAPQAAPGDGPSSPTVWPRIYFSLPQIGYRHDRRVALGSGDSAGGHARAYWSEGSTHVAASSAPLGPQGRRSPPGAPARPGWSCGVLRRASRWPPRSGGRGWRAVPASRPRARRCR